MTEPNLLGPQLEPPHGGLARLQQAVRQQQRIRGFRPGYWIAGAATAGLVALAVLVWNHNMSRQRQIHEAVRQALIAAPKTHFDNAAYIELPSHRQDVRILLIGSLSPPN